VIPARIGSERLPRKPLQLLAGRPLIEWVWRRVSAFSVLDAVVVATDSEEVAELCGALGADVVMTSSAHRSGTERAAEVVEAGEYAGYDVVVNVQGDEPLIAESHVAAVLDLVERGWDVGTIAVPLASAEELADPAVVKVVCRTDGGALLFSRAAIPHRRSGAPTPQGMAAGPYLRHVGLYAYRRQALRRWVALPQDAVEVLEQLEQMRPLRAGMRIGVGVAAAAERGVDTAEDLRRAAARLAELNETE
jgi:3-deoxy-manno-octulosonate cytidylyltransferase (CMP-KDO synthetase)